MGKRIAALAVIGIVAFAVNARGYDLNPGRARAGAKIWDPDKKPWDMNVKNLWAGGEDGACKNMTWVWTAWDGSEWDYADPNSPQRYWLYQIFEFEKPTGFDTGILNWRIWAPNSENVTIWRWDEELERWSGIDSYAGGSGMEVQHYGPVYAEWFDIQIDPGLPWNCYIMALVGETPGHIRADLCDMRWEP